MNLIFKKKSYSFKLSTKVENSKTTYLTKLGWIIKLTSNDKKKLNHNNFCSLYINEKVKSNW